MTSINFADSLSSVTTGLGTSKDKAASVTYTASVITDQELSYAYDGAWLPRKIVDQPAKDCFRKWREWQGDTATNGKIEAEEKRLNVRGMFERAYILARLYGRAHVYFDLGDDPSQPAMPDRVKAGGVRFAVALSRSDVADGDIDDDPMSPTYGLPVYYEVAGKGSLVRIHPSRMVTFYGDESAREMVYDRRGVSVLRAALPAIKRHDGIVANVAHLTHEARLKIISVPGLGEMLSDQEQSRQITDRFALFNQMMSNQALGLLSSSTNKDVPGEEFHQFTVSFATLPDIIEKAQEEVSAAASIPRAILFGASAGGLGSTGDLELSTYYDAIATMQKNDIEVAINVFDECLIRSALGSRPDDLWYQWASLWQMTDKEKAEIADKLTTSAERLIRMGMPLDVVAGPTVSALVEAGAFPGLEASMADYLDSNGDTLEPEMDEAALAQEQSAQEQEIANADQ